MEPISIERGRWEQIEQLYHEALEREPGARKSFLDEACAGAEDLRREVAGLLACDIPSDSFIQSPAIEIVARAIAVEPHIEAPSKPMRSLTAGSQIGYYRILSQLGAGGMGEVFLAQDTRLGRNVAVKLLPAEFTGDADRQRRFEREAQAASAINHPHVATIVLGHRQNGIGGAYQIITGVALGRRFGVVLDRLVVVGERAIQVASVVADFASIGVAFSEVAVDFDGAVKIGRRFVGLGGVKHFIRICAMRNQTAAIERHPLPFVLTRMVGDPLQFRFVVSHRLNLAPIFLRRLRGALYILRHRFALF